MSTSITLRAVNQARKATTFYLHLTNGLPSVLGTGRNAVVFLATDTEAFGNPATAYRAIKFLRDDVDKQYARAAASRFFVEAAKAQSFDLIQETFVRYYGWGAIDSPQWYTTEGRDLPFWWKIHFASLAKDLVQGDEANAQALERLREHYNLQGPFYVLDLCQGTLYDLLDKSTPWQELPAYAISTYRRSLDGQANLITESIANVTERYLTRSPAGRSGYDILNSFKTTPDANRLRSRAVLEIFSQITYAIALLHGRRPEGEVGEHESEIEPLAHRDLKPGNIFFQHAAATQGLRNIKILLSDLGYVTNAAQIISGDQTLLAGKRGIEYQAPGSQFYRAPEQADLPIEVRVDTTEQRNRVRVRGSKIDKIEIHDWLSLSDIFTDESRHDEQNNGLFKINAVRRSEDDHGEFYDLLLGDEISTSRTSDMQGQIIHSTGFQTDGFSLGAILYDMISGGKDPQQFYVYCIVSLAGGSRSIQEIMDILAPEPRPDGVSHEALNLAERRLMMPALLDASDLDSLFDDLQRIALQGVPFDPRTGLQLGDKVSLMFGEVLRARNIDDLIIGLIRSRLFAEGMPTLSNGNLPPDKRARLSDLLRNYRFRNFHQVHDLLRDKRGEPIPRDILRVIVACMVRDIEGSFYQRDPELGYNSEYNFAAAARIHKAIDDLLSKEAYQLPPAVEGFPKQLAEDLLFQLRCLARSTQPINANATTTTTTVVP